MTELEKEERVERREASIEARHEELRQEKVAGKKERIDDDQKALRRSMELEVRSPSTACTCTVC